MNQPALARAYLALQAAAGAAWWVAVFASDLVRTWTLGSWDPRWLVGPDLLLFVGGSALAAARADWRVAAVTTAWTGLLSVALLVYGLAERAAGWGVLLMAAATVGSLVATLTLRSGRMPTAWFFVDRSASGRLLRVLDGGMLPRAWSSSSCSGSGSSC